MNDNNNIPAEYKPISALGYLGYELLFSIPCVGIILLFVFAFGNGNINLKNFARSYLLLYLIIGIISIVFVLLFGTLFAVSIN